MTSIKLDAFDEVTLTVDGQLVTIKNTSPAAVEISELSAAGFQLEAIPNESASPVDISVEV